jgi:hypothetical protein
LHASRNAHRKATLWLAAIVGVLALSLAGPAISQAEESNPNNYNCLGSLAAGTPEAGSEEQQVQYTFYCNGPITGFQVQSQIPVTGVSSPPEVTNLEKKLVADTFSCSGELPGWAANCVGSTVAGYENVTGQFAIGSKLCAEPRVDAHRRLRLPRKRQSHPGHLRSLRPRTAQRLQARRLLQVQPLQPRAAAFEEGREEGQER